MEYIKKEELIIGEVYTHQNGNICRCDRNSNTSIYGKYINITHNVFRKPPENPGNFDINEMRLATPEEKHWLEICIQLDKFITFEESMETFVPKYVECIKEKKQYGFYGDLGKVYKVDNWNFSENDCMLIGTISGSTCKNRFKSSTKKAYDAQFIVKEPEFILPKKWCLKSTDDLFVKYCNINGVYSYSKNELINSYAHFPSFNNCTTSSEIKTGYIEITFEQFKKYVLKEEIIEEKIIEPLPHFKVIETIETITKVENNEGNQFFIGDVVKRPHGLKYNITSFKYNENKTEILAICNNNDNLFVNINEIEHYIEPKVEFILPEKWAILRTNENDKVVTNYINSISSINHAYLNNNRHNPYLHNITNECCSSYKIFTNYTEITFDQFKKYILK